MIAHPKRAVKIGVGRMEGDSRQFIEKSVGQKGQRGRQSQGNAAWFYSAKSFLDEDAGQDVGWFLHGDYKASQMRLWTACRFEKGRASIIIHGFHRLGRIGRLRAFQRTPKDVVEQILRALVFLVERQLGRDVGVAAQLRV